VLPGHHRFTMSPPLVRAVRSRHVVGSGHTIRRRRSRYPERVLKVLPSVVPEVEMAVQAESARPFVSTGHLPDAATVTALLTETHERFASNTDGANSDVYPALARVPADLFGICVAATNGAVFEVGDTDVAFSVMSVSKPFVFALVCQEIGATRARKQLG